MLPIWIIYIAVAMRLGGSLAYLRATLSGRAKPDPVSWLLWGIIPIIAFIAEVQAGVGLAAIITLAVGISPLIVFCAAMYKNRYSFKLRGFNLICVIMAVVGIAIWTVTSDPFLAITLMILADIASTLPTIIKTIKNPKSEFAASYLVSSLSMLLALFAIDQWSFAALAYPAYIMAINLFIFLLASRKKDQPKRRQRVSI